MELFNIRIPRVSGLTDTGFVPDEPSSSPRWAIDSTGTKWVRKREDDSGPPELLAEALSWLLGTALEVPMPSVGVCLDPGERSWLSRYIPNTKHWDPDLADRVANFDGLGRMLALDAIVHNDDRHPGNLLVAPTPDAALVHVYAIDFGVATVGYPKALAAKRAEPPPVRTHVRGLPLRQVWEHADDAAKRASELTESEIRSWASEACGIAGEKDVELLSATLVERCRCAPAIVAAHLTAVAKLR